MKYRDYLPPIYEHVLEVEAVSKAFDPFNEDWMTKMYEAHKDNFPAVATITGIMAWEIILGIKANPVTENEQFRRERIINRLSATTPFTERFLIERMNDIFGEGNWSYVLDYRNYELEINSLIPGRNWVIEIELLFDEIIPCNIRWRINMFYQTWNTVNENHTDWQEVLDYYDNWQQVWEGKQ